MNRNDFIKKWNTEVVFLEPEIFDDGIIGITEDKQHLVYSYNKLVDVIKEDETEDAINEAMEFIDYNTLRSIPYMGENKPIIMYDI